MNHVARGPDVQQQGVPPAGRPLFTFLRESCEVIDLQLGIAVSANQNWATLSLS